MLTVFACLIARATTPAEGVPQAVPEPITDEAPPPVAIDPADIHEALRSLRVELLDAVKTRNVDAMLKTLHPDVVFTATNGEAVRGREGVRAYIEKMIDGPDALVKDFSYEITSDELSILYGDDTAIAWGPSSDHYELASGDSFDLKTRWSATLVRVDGRWLIASAHSSVNLFDNAVLDQASAMIPKVGIATLACGLLIGLLTGFLAGRISKR